MQIGPRWVSGRRLIHAGIAAVVLLVGLVASAFASGPPPLTLESFVPSAPQGFGDRQNSWAWAMGAFNNHILVGTNRAYRCIASWEHTQTFGSIYPYPPPDPDLSCTQSPADLPMQAEIWNLDTTTNLWSRVYQSPNTIPNPDPRFPGKFIPAEDGFRTITTYTESNGTQAEYIGGVTTAPMWNGLVPPPRILRSTDGVNWTPIPQDPGTFMGTLPEPSFRGFTQYNGQLFAVNGTVEGQGVIIASSNPSAGDNAWQQVSPPGQQFYDMAVFNGWLYVGSYDTVNGYSVYKTKATGSPPYVFTPVITNGAGVTGSPAISVVSMEVSNGRLYVGTAVPAELIRINADDTWDLIEGAPRQYNGQWKYPLTGLGNGFDNGFNIHIWRMIDLNNQLYAGTYDSSIVWKGDKLVANRIKQVMGFDLYGSGDGWYWSTITTTGFGNYFDYGLRNFAKLGNTLYLGTTNDFYGANVFRAILTPIEPPRFQLGPGAQSDEIIGSLTQPESRTPAPTQLQVEVSHNQPLLSWVPVLGAVRYHILRAPLVTILLPSQPPPIDWDPYGSTTTTLGLGLPLADAYSQTAAAQIADAWPLGRSPTKSGSGAAAQPNGSIPPGVVSQISYVYPGNFVDIGTTNDTVFVDQPLTSTAYVYVVTTANALGQQSDLSNLVQVPSLYPTMTYTQANAYVQQLNARNLFTSPTAYTNTVNALQQSQTQETAGDYAGAMDTLKGIVQSTLSGTLVPAPDSTDLSIVIDRLERRVKLENSGFVDPSTLN